MNGKMTQIIIKIKFNFYSLEHLKMFHFHDCCCLPFSSQLGDNQRNLKPLVVPFYNNISSMIRLVRSNNDNCAFIQTRSKENSRYRIEIHEIKIPVYKIRFSSIGYALNTAKIFKNTHGSVGLPSLVVRFDSEPLSFHRTLVFKSI